MHTITYHDVVADAPFFSPFSNGKFIVVMSECE